MTAGESKYFESAESALTFLVQTGPRDPADVIRERAAASCVIEDELRAAREWAARAQRALDEERQRSRALFETVEAACREGTAVGDGPRFLLASALTRYERPDAFAELPQLLADDEQAWVPPGGKS